MHDIKQTYSELLGLSRSFQEQILSSATEMKSMTRFEDKKKEYIKIEKAVETAMRGLVLKHHPDHLFFSEGEEDMISRAKDVWLLDPVSGIAPMTRGLPNYAVALSHLHDGNVIFSLVYDPTTDELFTAQKDNGAFMNDIRLQLKDYADSAMRVLLTLTMKWPDQDFKQAAYLALSRYDTYRPLSGHATHLPHVAAERYDGSVILAKDPYPHFAGNLILTEAGGVFTNINGDAQPSPHDRIFVAGSREYYAELFPIISALYKKSKENRT